MNYIKLFKAVLLSHMAGIIGSFFTVSEIDNWYKTLARPELTPPDWIFGPVWLTLYTLMGISLYLVWQSENRTKKAVNCFYLQLVLNASWSIVFFGAHEVFLALIVIVTLVLSVIKVMMEFWKINKTAFYLLVPYLLWISFATYLNYSILVLN